MSNITVERLLEIAAAEIGYCEKKSNSQLDDKTANAGSNDYTKYARDLHKAGYYQASKQGFAWCDCFADHCYLQLCDGDAVKAQDLTCQTGPYGAGVDWSAKYYKQQNRYFTSNPQPGDQVFFGNGGFQHTGIVEKVVGSTLYTIEGNTSNKVARRSYSLSNPYVRGFGRPKWEKYADATEPAPAPAPAPTPAPAPSTGANGVKVGDIVDFTGNKHYTSANATSGPSCKPGKAKVTQIYQLGKSKHPYHLVRVSGGGSTVYGWVDAADISGATEAPAKKPVATIKVGSTVRLNKGAKTYNGGGLASFVYNRNHKVMEIAGDRVVITYSGVVIAAVKLSDLTLIS